MRNFSLGVRKICMWSQTHRGVGLCSEVTSFDFWGPTVSKHIILAGGGGG